MEKNILENIRRFISLSKQEVEKFNEVFGDAGELLAVLNRGSGKNLLNSPTEINCGKFVQYYLDYVASEHTSASREVVRFLSKSLVFIGWYYSRSVAVFTPELEEELQETTTNVDLDPNIFERLRGFPVYVPFARETEKSYGALVALIDKNVEGVALAFVKANFDNSFKFTPVILEDNGIFNLNRIIDKLELAGWPEAEAVEVGIKTLYVITERSQINPSSGYQPRIIKKKGRPEKFAAPDNYKTVVFGEQFTNAIREYRTHKTEYESRDPKRTVRPHVRRAHWHTFLTGPRNEKRTQVVKWIPPIFVMSDDN